MRQRRRDLVLFVALLAGAVAFVGITSRGLPEVVASHFNAGGAADAFASRSRYVTVMVAVVLGLPLLLAMIGSVALAALVQRRSRPHQHDGRPPEHPDETAALLRRLGQVLISGLAIFFCYMHWLVVRANRLEPPHLSTPAVVAGLVVLLVALLVWLCVLYRRVKIPSEPLSGARSRPNCRVAAKGWQHWWL